LVEESFYPLHGVIGVRGGSNHFDPIAGCKDNGFPSLRTFTKLCERFRDLGFFKCDTFPYFDGRATVVEADYEDFCVHELFEPTSMPPRKNRISPQEITENYGKADNREKSRLLAP
jgi:hypothetical protein